MASLPLSRRHYNCCLSYVVNILLGFAYFARPFDVLKTVHGPHMSYGFYADKLKSGGVELGDYLNLCNFSDRFGTY